MLQYKYNMLEKVCVVMNNEEKNQILGEESVEQIKIPAPEEEVKPKKKTGKIILIIILLLVAVAIGLYFGLKKLSTNPLSIYKNAINDTYNLVDNYLKESFDNLYNVNINEEPIKIDSNFTLNTNEEDYAMLNNFEYNLSLGLNLPNEQMNLSFGLSDEEGSIMNLLLAFINDRMYLESDELYNVPLDLGPSELDFSGINFDEVSTFDYNTIHIILETTKNILIDSLDENKFTIIDSTIELNNEQVSVKKLTYLLDEENMKRTMDYITTEMKNNDEFITALSDVTGLTSEEIKSSLEEDIDYSNFTDIEINLFLNNKDDIIAGNLIENEEELIKFTIEDKLFDLFIGDEYNSITMTKEENTLNISYNKYEEEIFFISLTDEENKETIEYRTNSYGDDIIIKVELSNIKSSENSYSADIILDYSMTSYGVESKFNLEGNMEIVNAELDNIDTTNSVNVDNLTEEESLVFYENLLELLDRIGLTDLSSIL